jgi:hypothetical protein
MSEDFWDLMGGKHYLEVVLGARKFKSGSTKKTGLSRYSFFFDDKIFICEEIKVKHSSCNMFTVSVRSRNSPFFYNCTTVGPEKLLDKNSIRGLFSWLSGGKDLFPFGPV